MQIVNLPTNRSGRVRVSVGTMKPHSVRYTSPGWELVCKAARQQGMDPGAYARETSVKAAQADIARAARTKNRG